MIDRVSVYNGQTMLIGADPNDVSKAPVYQKLLDTTSVVAKTPLLAYNF